MKKKILVFIVLMMAMTVAVFFVACGNGNGGGNGDGSGGGNGGGLGGGNGGGADGNGNGNGIYANELVPSFVLSPPANHDELYEQLKAHFENHPIGSYWYVSRDHEPERWHLLEVSGAIADGTRCTVTFRFAYFYEENSAIEWYDGLVEDYPSENIDEWFYFFHLSRNGTIVSYLRISNCFC